VILTPLCSLYTTILWQIHIMYFPYSHHTDKKDQEPWSPESVILSPPPNVLFFFIYIMYYWSWNCSYLGGCSHTAAWLTFHSFGMTGPYSRGTEFIKKFFVVCKICTQQVFLLRPTVSSWMLLCVLCMKWIKRMDNGRLDPFTHPNASSPVLLNRCWRNLVLWSLHLNQKGPDV
jgi:hypothetical protein